MVEASRGCCYGSGQGYMLDQVRGSTCLGQIRFRHLYGSDQVPTPLWFRSVILTPQILQYRPGLLNGHILKWHRREVLPEQLLTNRMLPGHSGGVHDEVHDKLPASTLSHFTQGRAYETTLQGVTRFTFGRKNSPPLLHHLRVDLAKLDPFGDGSDAMFQFEIGQTRFTFGGLFNCPATFAVF